MSGDAEADILDVDARFLLANERTLLAWIRTALTLLAGGVGIQQFGNDVRGRTALASTLIVVGIAAVLGGGWRYVAADRAIRHGRLPLAGRAPLALTGAVAVLGVVVLVAVLLAG